MPKTPDFDVSAAHQYFAAHCFNRAWDLIDQQDRTPEDDRLMVALSQASIFHWLQRPDCTNQHLSIGYWQASRIQALLGNSSESLHYARVCLSFSSDLAPFYVGYAHEALARGYHLSGDVPQTEEHLKRGRELANQVTDASERDLLLADLASIEKTACTM